MNDKRRFSSDGERVATAEPEVKWRIRPRHKWVLIRKLEVQEQVTDGGIVKPGSNTMLMDKVGAPSSRGLVVEVSQAITDLMPGDLVVFTNFPTKLKDLSEYLPDDTDLHLVRDEEVYAVVERCT